MDTQLDVPGLATAYRRMVLCVGIQFLLGFAMAGLGPPILRASSQLSSAAALEGSDLGALVGIGGLLFALVTLLLLAIYAYRTARACGSRVPVLWALAMVIPVISLLTLAALSSKATRACNAAGIPVGLLGPKLVGAPTGVNQAR